MVMINDTAVSMSGADYVIYSSTGDNILNEVVQEVEKEFDILGFPDLEYGYIINSNGNYVPTILDGVKINKAIDLKMIDLKDEKNVDING